MGLTSRFRILKSIRNGLTSFGVKAAPVARRLLSFIAGEVVANDYRKAALDQMPGAARTQISDTDPETGNPTWGYMVPRDADKAIKDEALVEHKMADEEIEKEMNRLAAKNFYKGKLAKRSYGKGTKKYKQAKKRYRKHKKRAHSLSYKKIKGNEELAERYKTAVGEYKLKRHMKKRKDSKPEVEPKKYKALPPIPVGPFGQVKPRFDITKYPMPPVPPKLRDRPVKKKNEYVSIM